MEFVEVMKDWRRMCAAMSEKDEYTACDRCLLQDFGCPAIYETDEEADWAHVESVVTKWAEENPVKQYPTWWEWLYSLGAVTRKVTPDTAFELIEAGLLDHIPDNIAKKFGIAPKEDA